MKHYTIVVLGGGGVGKSSLIFQLTSGVFVKMYNPTIEDSFNVLFDVDNETVSLNIIDTAGQEEYTSLIDQYVKSGNGFILVYSIVSSNSFLDVSRIRNHIFSLLNKHKNEQICIVLCGNKCDMEQQRQITTLEAKQISKEWSCPFFESSAKEGINIKEPFECLIKEMKRNKVKYEEIEESTASLLPTKKPKKKRFCFIF